MGSGIVTLAGTIAGVYSATQAPAGSSAWPYLGGVAAGGLLTSTFFALAAYLLGDDPPHVHELPDPSREPGAAVGDQNITRARTPVVEDENTSPCYAASGRREMVARTSTCAQHGLLAINIVGILAGNRDLNGMNLTRVNLTRVDFARANLTSANLTSANLAGADLTGADLTGANLAHANLTSANLTGANLTGVRCNAATRWPAGFTPPTCAP